MIAVVTEIPRFYYDAVQELKGRGIDFFSLAPGQEIPSVVSVVLTSEEEKDGVDFPRVVSARNVKTAVSKCVKILNGLKEEYDKLVIGIDPGPRPGIAALGGRQIVEVNRLNAPEDVLVILKDIFNVYPADVLFRVGTGGGIYRKRILKMLQDNFDFRIEMVDESSTTPSAVGAGSISSFKDAIAAVNIALKEGRVLVNRVRLSPTAGEIRNLQKESRKFSGNITISKKLAARVALGELTLEEAVVLQRKHQ